MGRDPYDGEPFYCVTCGFGYGEYIACEDVACKLESREKAQSRKQRRRAVGSDSKAYAEKDAKEN